jgi:hypothetical protein
VPLAEIAPGLRRWTARHEEGKADVLHDDGAALADALAG